MSVYKAMYTFNVERDGIHNLPVNLPVTSQVSYDQIKAWLCTVDRDKWSHVAECSIESSLYTSVSKDCPLSWWIIFCMEYRFSCISRKLSIHANIVCKIILFMSDSRTKGPVRSALASCYPT